MLMLTQDQEFAMNKKMLSVYALEDIIVILSSSFQVPLVEATDEALEG